MKQRDARRKRSRTSPSGTDGFRIPKTGSDKRSGGSIFARSRKRISRENPGDQESVVAATPVRRSFPIRGFGGGGGTLRGNRDGKTQKRATNSYVQDIYILLVTFLPVRGGWIPVRDARYHNGVFQPGGHINHLLVYHRRHGAAYLCEKKTDKSCNDSEDGNDT